MQTDQKRVIGKNIKQEGEQDSDQKMIKKIQNYTYRYNDLLGEGNFSKVYKGINQKTNQQVAVKVVQLASLNSQKMKQLLTSQIQILKKIKHQNVLRCYDVLTSSRNCYIITELCQGGDLSTLIKKSSSGYLKENQIYRVALDIFKALQYLSQRGIVHRDIKVANIFISEKGAKLADFGFAKFSRSNFIDISIGSPIYMAPQGLIKNVYGPKTDIWAYGVLLYQLTHGNAPCYQCKNQFELKKQLNKQIQVENLNKNLSLQFKQLIVRCLNIDYKKRISIQQIRECPWIKKVLKQIGQQNIIQPIISSIIKVNKANSEELNSQTTNNYTPNRTAWQKILNGRENNQTHSQHSMSANKSDCQGIKKSLDLAVTFSGQSKLINLKNENIFKPSQNFIKLAQTQPNWSNNFIALNKKSQSECQKIINNKVTTLKSSFNTLAPTNPLEQTTSTYLNGDFDRVQNLARSKQNCKRDQNNSNLKQKIDSQLLNKKQQKIQKTQNKINKQQQLNYKNFIKQSIADKQSRVIIDIDPDQNRIEQNLNNDGLQQLSNISIVSSVINNKSKSKIAVISYSQYKEKLLNYNDNNQLLIQKGQSSNQVIKEKDCLSKTYNSFGYSKNYIAPVQKINNVTNKIQLQQKNNLIDSNKQFSRKQQKKITFNLYNISTPAPKNQKLSNNSINFKTSNQNKIQANVENYVNKSQRKIRCQNNNLKLKQSIKNSIKAIENQNQKFNNYYKQNQLMSLLPGSIQFLQCIGILHYCRLIYKFINLAKQIYKQKDYDLLINWLMLILTELNGKVQRKEVNYSRLRNVKQGKLRSVLDQYVQKYSKQFMNQSKSVSLVTQWSNKKFKQNLNIEKMKKYWHEWFQLIEKNLGMFQKNLIKNSLEFEKYEFNILLGNYCLVLSYSTYHIIECQNYDYKNQFLTEAEKKCLFNQQQSDKINPNQTDNIPNMRHNRYFRFFENNASIQQALQLKRGHSHLSIENFMETKNKFANLVLKFQNKKKFNLKENSINNKYTQYKSVQFTQTENNQKKTCFNQTFNYSINISTPTPMNSLNIQNSKNNNEKQKNNTFNLSVSTMPFTNLR